MGLFGTSKEEKFKNSFVDFWNLLARLSYREISWELAANKVVAIRNDLFSIAREFNDPFSSYFKRYTYNTGVFGEKTSIGEGIVIALLAFDYSNRGGRLTQDAELMISNQAKMECSTEAGRNGIRKLIREYKCQ